MKRDVNGFECVKNKKKTGRIINRNCFLIWGLANVGSSATGKGVGITLTGPEFEKSVKSAQTFHQKFIYPQNYNSKYHKCPNFIIKYSFCPNYFLKVQKCPNYLIEVQKCPN